MLSDLAQYVLSDALTRYEKSNEYHTGITASLLERAIAEIRQTCLQGPVRVLLRDVGEKRIQTIRVIRAYTNLSLKAAKDVIDACSPPIGSIKGRMTYAEPRPVLIPGEFRLDDANRLVAALAGVGAKGEINA